MNTAKKLTVLMGLLSVLCAIPAMAQINPRVKFDAPSAFYAGDAKLPAGGYTVSVPNEDDNFLLIQSTDGSHSVIVEYEITSSERPHTQSALTLNKNSEAEVLT